MSKDNYVYAVTRVHSNELNLLSSQDIEQLVSAKNAVEAFRLLSEKGWGAPDLPPHNADALIAYETQKTWDLIGELAGNLEPFNVFRYKSDFHNLKAAIKLAYTNEDGGETAGYFLPFGTVEPEVILKAAQEHDFSCLSDEMAAAGRQAYETLAHTGSGQSCDMLIDRAALTAISRAGQNSGSSLLRRYAEITCDCANIKAAVRCARMQKPRDFVERALAPAGTLDIPALTDAASSGAEAVYTFLGHTAYAGAVDALKSSMAAFERWCDNQMIEMIRPQRYNYFGIEPLAAFILGRENEIAMVRLILSAKLNALNEAALRERLREMYV